MSALFFTRGIAAGRTVVGSVALSLMLCTAAIGATGQPPVQQLHAETEVARALLQRAERQLQFAQNLYNQAYYNGSSTYGGGGYGNGAYGGGYGGGYPSYYDQQARDRAQQQMTRVSDALPGLQADAKQAAQHLDEVKKDIEKRKADLDAAQQAVDVTVAGREKAFKDGQPYQDAQAAVREAEAAQSAAELRLVKALAASDPAFRKMQAQVAELEARVKALREATPPAEANTIAEASKRWVDAKGQLVRRIDAAKDKDSQAVAARDQLNTAKAALSKLKRDFNDSLKDDPAVADARRVLDQSRPAYQGAVKELTQAKREARATQAAVNDAVAALQAAAADLAQAYGGAAAGAGVGWQYGGGGIYGVDPFTIAQDRLNRAQAERDRAAQAFNDAVARERAAIAGTTPATPGTSGAPVGGAAVASNVPAAGPTTAPIGGGVAYGQIAPGTRARPGTKGIPATIPPSARAPRFVGGSIVRPQSAAESVADATAASAQTSAATSAANAATDAAATSADPVAGANAAVGTAPKATVPAATATGPAATQARARALARERYEQRRVEWASRDRTRRAMQDQQAAGATPTTPGVVDRRQAVQAQGDAEQQQQQPQLQQRQLTQQMQQQQLQQQQRQQQMQQQQAAQQRQQAEQKSPAPQPPPQQQQPQKEQQQQQQQQSQSTGSRTTGR